MFGADTESRLTGGVPPPGSHAPEIAFRLERRDESAHPAGVTVRAEEVCVGFPLLGIHDVDKVCEGCECRLSAEVSVATAAYRPLQQA
jgi:hypothetical protein